MCLCVCVLPFVKKRARSKARPVLQREFGMTLPCATASRRRPGCPSPPIRAGQLPDARLSGEGRLREGLQGDGHELHGVVVRRRAVGARGLRSGVQRWMMAHSPPSPHPHAHWAPTTPPQSAGPVAWLVVGMLAGQAVRAMVAMFAARARCDDGPAAYLADEQVVACMGAVVAFWYCFLLFSLFMGCPPESNVVFAFLPGGHSRGLSCSGLPAAGNLPCSSA